MKKDKRITVVLLDAHAILHRSYHAMGGFATRDGKPTGALYGFVSMILRMYNEIEPDYIAACFDLPKPTFRHLSYDGYKSGRKKSDDALISQIQESYKVCEALSVPVYKEEGFEADDILGTISEQLKKEEGVRVIIASGDMDTFQLIDDDKVVVYTLRKGNDGALFDEKGVFERYGFLPTQIPDYKGLAGDTSDNITGVPGIGEKTATELIKKYGSIENIYLLLKKDKTEMLKNGIKERTIKLLEEGEEDAFFSKTLATIRRDAPVVYEKPVKIWKETINDNAYETMCDLYEFRSLRNKLNILKGNAVVESKKIDESDLEELRVMIHLLHSEMTNQKQEDIEKYTNQKEKEKIKEILLEELKEKGLLDLFLSVEKPLIGVVKKMKENGIVLNVSKLEEMSKDLHFKVKELEKSIYSLSGKEFNISSPKQLGDVLYDDLSLGTKIKKTKTGQKSTNVSELEKIKDEHEIVKLILLYREYTKLLSTYVDVLPSYVKDDNRIHAHFVQTGTGTGRFSCEEPNLQNLPVKSEIGQKIRGAFVADKNKVLLSCDYAQIDLRSAAILSLDENLVQIFKKGIDVHTGTAAKVFNVKEENVTSEMRRSAKAINFGILYGMGVTSLKESMGVDRKEAQDFYNQYKNTFIRLMEYLEEVKAFAWKYGYTKTLLGREREVPLLKSPLPFLRAQGERIAINAPIQGTSADILKLAMLDTDSYITKNKLEGKVKLLLQIHDELVFEIEKGEEEKISNDIVNILESVLSSRKLSDIPLVVSKHLGVSLETI